MVNVAESSVMGTCLSPCMGDKFCAKIIDYKLNDGDKHAR